MTKAIKNLNFPWKSKGFIKKLTFWGQVGSNLCRKLHISSSNVVSKKVDSTSNLIPGAGLFVYGLSGPGPNWGPCARSRARDSAFLGERRRVTRATAALSTSARGQRGPRHTTQWKYNHLGPLRTHRNPPCNLKGSSNYKIIFSFSLTLAECQITLCTFGFFSSRCALSLVVLLPPPRSKPEFIFISPSL